MKKLPLEGIQPGEIVARPVVTTSGVVLVQPGTVLTAEILARLEALRIDTIWLEGPSPDARPVEELLQEIEHRFGGHEDDALMMELKAVAVARVGQGAD